MKAWKQHRRDFCRCKRDSERRLDRLGLHRSAIIVADFKSY